MTLIAAIIVWGGSFFLLPLLDEKKEYNLVQQINFGTVNAILVLLIGNFYF